ncbi:MAG TPA: ribonuclease III [Candidatus Absconditabacterales bacterium]|nr:ribonuclease III [Candidatus Absconditabacterales bacterium]HOQ79002.1 ribonuclease III [Candidatus Absconditabacterales bacterium]HPK28156.1 ribonuclease III [Candidatus Absconditabacterales bacterium]
MLNKKVLEQKEKIYSYIKELGLDPSKIKNEGLLLQAFVHKSFAADFKKILGHNERLEFVGDGVLGAIVCKLLFQKHPKMDESEMTLYKIALVREGNLAQVARNINLDKHILVSRGEEKTQGRKKDAILADALEALIGFVFLDFGYAQAEVFVEKNVYTMYNKISKKPIQSYKTMVQEHLQKLYKELPSYKDIEHEIDSKGNVLTYKAEIYVLGVKKAEGFGTNKKKAQEDAAQNFYESIKA